MYDALVQGGHEDPFIKSVHEEITENSSEAMSELTALVSMNGQQMFDFLDAVERSTDSLVLPKDYATLGVFNQWSGCGGTLDIQLEKDAVLPLSMVREFNIEGQKEVPGSYTVDSVYGLVSSMWCPNLSYREGTETGIKEDYGAALVQARETFSEAAKKVPGVDDRVSLKSEAEASRMASEALAGSEIHNDREHETR